MNSIPPPTDLRQEATYVGKYAGSGIVNTLVGFAFIFSAMGLGLSPFVANCIGYAVGFFLGFILTKKWVFRSQGHIVFENIRYLIAFLISFLLNLFVLHICINVLMSHPVLAQIVAASSYTSLMFLLTRFFVFRAGILQGKTSSKDV